MKPRFLFLLITLAGLLAAASTAACGASEPASSPAQASAAKRVLIVHSYSNLFPWTRDLNNGVIEGLRRTGYTTDQQYQLKTFFMDTRITYTSPEGVRQRAAEALEMIEDFRPDILFVTDDNALRDVAVSYAQQHPNATVSTVFSGINVDPSIYTPIQSLDRLGGPITGALERVPYYEAFQLGKRLFPAASKIVILGDASTSSRFVANTFRQDYPGSAENPPLEVLDFVLLKTFQEWKEKVLESQNTADIIGVLNYHQLRDENGAIVAPWDVVDWMAENNRLPELGLVAEWAEDGILMSAGNSGYKTGIYAGVLGENILSGQDPGAIPIVDPKEIDAAYNVQRARILGITFPPDELVAAAAVYHTMGGGD